MQISTGWDPQPVWRFGTGNNSTYSLNRPSGLGKESMADHLLELRVRIPSGKCVSLVNVVCFEVEVATTSQFLV